MLDNETKRRIDTARDILVGKVPDPKSQVEQITIALVYKFMDDMDKESVAMGGEASFFTGDYERYAWSKIFDPRIGGHEMLGLYAEAIVKLNLNPNIPQLFRDIFKNAYLPYRDPETLKLFLKTINEFTYDHSERLGDAFEYLLSVLGSQGDAGQFRTPRHIIDFIVRVVSPQKHETILDPACGTAGFLISSYKHILKGNTKKIPGDQLTTDERKKLLSNFKGFDISPDMVRLSLVNLYLHGFVQPQILEYDTLTSEDHWNEYADVIMANPPFMSPKGGIKPHKKFSVQSNRSEVLFVDYIAEHLTPTGRAAVIVPEGIIFQSAGAYKQLRKMLVENHLYAVVSLPAGIFNPYSGVKTSILLMDRQIAKKSDSILFVKIENDGFGLGAQRREQVGSDLPDAVNVISDYVKMIRSPQAPLERISSSPQAPLNKGGTEGGGMSFSQEFLKSRGLIWNGSHLPYNPDMVERAKKMRKEMTAAEKKLWFEFLRSFKFRVLRQRPIDNYIVDFYCSELKCVIEVDGESHFTEEGKVYDNERTKILESYGLSVFRFNNDEVLNNFDSVCERISSSPQAPLDKGGAEGGGIFQAALERGFALLVKKAKLAENEEYNLTAERYRTTEKRGNQKWPMVKLGEVCSFEYGKSLPEKQRINGQYPVMGSNGRTGFHDEFLIEGPAIIIGRKGSAGEVVWEEENCFPIDTTYYLKADLQKINLKWFYLILKNINLSELSGGTGIPGLNRNDAYQKEFPLPPLEVQREIVAEIESYKKLIDGARQVVESWKPLIPPAPLNKGGAEGGGIKEWPMVKLGEVHNVISGYSFESKDFLPDNPIKCIKITNVGVNEFIIDETGNVPLNYIDKYSSFIANTGDIVISLTRCRG